MITGKELYEAARPHLEKMGMECIEWDNFVPGAREFYLETAQQLNEVHFMPVHKRVNDLAKLLLENQVERHAQGKEIASLKALVQDFVTLLEDDELVIEDNSDGWWTKREHALSQANQLTGEEQSHASI